MVYTYVGDIVVSVNPFKNTGCYGKAIRAKFKGGSRRTLAHAGRAGRGLKSIDIDIGYG